MGRTSSGMGVTLRARSPDAPRRRAARLGQRGSRSRRKAMSAPCPSAPPGVSHTTGTPAGGAPRRRARPGRSPPPEVGVPVARRSRTGRVQSLACTRSIAAGDGLDPVDRVGELLRRPRGVAGVEAEADAVTRPTASQSLAMRVEVAGHRVVAARGVLDQHRQRRRRSARRSCASCRTPIAGSSSFEHVAAVHDQRRSRRSRRRRRRAAASSLRLGIRIRLLVVATLIDVGRVDVEVDRRPPRQRPRAPRAPA